MIDLFGNEIIEDVLLRDRFIEPPFSVLDTRSGHWQSRKRKWIEKGIKSEVGRPGIHAFENCKEWQQDNNGLTFKGNSASFDFYRVKKGIRQKSDTQGTSIFDPALCELMYTWFCPKGGRILDPFAGGSVRGIVAHYLGYKYTGIELRPEQVESNRDQASDILHITNQPQWHEGDSDKLLDDQWAYNFDMIFSCPPYVNLEVYSDLPDDLSNMNYSDFLIKYKSIIKKSLKLLKKDSYIVWVVGEVRDKQGYYYDFVSDTKKAFIENGAKLYNDCILLNVVGSASMRAGKQFEASKKLVKIHQNILILKKC